MEPDSKILFWGFGAKRVPKIYPKWGFPSFVKSNGEIFLFLYEVIVAYKLKIDLNNFLGKYCFQVFGPKGSWNGPKSQILFQLIFQIKSQCMELFWVFCMTVHHHNNLENNRNIFFENKFVFEVLGPNVAHNGPNMRFFWYYQNSMHGTFLIFCMKLQQNKL